MHQRRRIRNIVAGWFALVLFAGPTLAASWDPNAFAKEETLKLRTNCPGEGEYWFPVWLVVVNEQVYVRLGSKAASRFECNGSKPMLGVEVAGQRFDAVQAVLAPEERDAVNQAMAAKYSSDLLIRWFPHPLVVRLVPQP